MAKPLPSGIYGLIGAPGSGKSYKAVREIAYSACTQARPIYTNIPIQPKKLRAYIYRKLPKSIKGHAARKRRANLVKSISKRHFCEFCKRLALIDQEAEKVMDEMGTDRHAIGELAEFRMAEARNEAMRRVSEKYGDPVLVGRQANWIAPGSVLFLDELHKWFPSKSYKDEPKEILDFTSMHRHMQLKVIVISQRWMNVSLSFRSMAREVWYCMNYSKRPVLGFLKFDRWFNIFRYMHFNGEDIEERTGLPRPGAKPVWSEMVWPELNGGIEYDLYRSYSHAGTLEQQAAEISKVTAAMMGGEDESEYLENKENEMPKRNTIGQKLNKAIVYMGVFGIAFTIGRCTSPNTTTVVMGEAEERPVTEEEKTGVVHNAGVSESAPELPPVWVNRRITSMANNWVMIEGRKYEVGQKHEDLLLLGVDSAAGDSAWIATDQGISYRWRIGGVPQPGRVPPAVRERWLAALRSRDNTATPAGPAEETPDVNAP